ncbi:hypothetical protein HW555_013083 [Spodoptera exigua]|uniref:Uncharacterized protein n=1 Tax=Spodoptera exigua TaxID=7107 RepID=A0A835L2W9_SPOEX|nr:hypothetical protein HW555_013083 [Spodoptera exigua]
MAKTKSFIIIVSVTVIVLFCVMCYLMTTVNPPPLAREQLPSKNVGKTILHDNIMFDNPRKDYGQYKLWKPDQESLADLASFSTAQVIFDQEFNTLWTFPTPRGVSNAARNTLINRTIPLPTLKVLNKTEDVDRETTTAGLNGTLIIIPVKRSVQEFKKIKGEVNSILLRLMDDSRQFNIEVKVGINDSYWNGNDKNRVKKKPSLTMYLKTENDDMYEESDLTKYNSNEPNDDSVQISIRDEYDRTFTNKTEHLKLLNEINNNDNVAVNRSLEEHVDTENKSNNDTSINEKIAKNNTYNLDNITDHHSTKIYKSIDISENVTNTTKDFNTEEYNVAHDENSIKMNDTVFQRDYTTEFFSPTQSKTFVFIDKVFSKVVQKLGDVTKKYNSDVYGFTINDATTENMDFDNLIPMENVTIQPLQLSTRYVTSTIHFADSINNNNSSQAFPKDNNTVLKINESNKYKNLPIVFPKSMKFAVDSAPNEGLPVDPVEDTR